MIAGIIAKKPFYSILCSVLIAGNSFLGTGANTGLPFDLLQSGENTQEVYVNPVAYYIHPGSGDDANDGRSMEKPFRTLDRVENLVLHPGDRIVLADGQLYPGSLKLINQEGSPGNPVLVTSENWHEKGGKTPATIDFKGQANGVLIEDCSYITLSNIRLSGNGYENKDKASAMRCGVLVTSSNKSVMKTIRIDHLYISDVFFENRGFARGKEEVHTANGTQKYGWGIRIIDKDSTHRIEDVVISNCEIRNVGHTGIKLTGNTQNIRDVKIIQNKVIGTGGPGMQMSEVQSVYVAENLVDHSGSTDDSRKWGRGSGIWTWGSTDVLIEKNRFLYANGPGDSNGAHIDFNCTNIIIQYNLSAYNAGGFCEILGNNYNCTYRYNVSVNDGHRIKGVNGAFQEGKTLWLSGYQGTKQKRKGPVNTYIYNNTIYTDASIHPKLAFDNTSRDVLIANNIFCTSNPFQLVLGDQYKPDVSNNKRIANMQVRNNLFLSPESWPAEIPVEKESWVYGDPGFRTPGGLAVQDYMPKNITVIKNRGVKLSPVKNDPVFPYALVLEKDIMGKPVPDQPSIGALEPGNN